MLTLALDTSGDICSVAVASDEKLLSEYSFAHNRRLTERLPGIVEFVLKDAGATLETVDAFAVGLGPGSFTGVRVGVTMAKVWAEVLGKPLFGVSSLDALAMESELPRVVVVPSRKDEVIAAYYTKGLAIRTPYVGPEVVATADLPARACALLNTEKVAVLGECASWFADSGLLWSPRSVRAANVAELAAARHLGFQNPDDPATLSPLYVAPPPIRGNLATK